MDLKYKSETIENLEDIGEPDEIFLDPNLPPPFGILDLYKLASSKSEKLENSRKLHWTLDKLFAATGNITVYDWLYQSETKTPCCTC